MDTRAEIRKFLGKSFRNYTFRDDENMFAAGFVNSLFAMQLIAFVESTFGISVESDDLEISNFNSIEAIRQFVERKSMR
jgi:methoxymalonate biosynthesis acyl carrier protein